MLAGAPGGQLPPGAQVGGAAPPAGGAAPPPAAGGTKPGIRIPNPLEVLLGGAAGAMALEAFAGAAEERLGPLVGAVAGGVSDFLDSHFLSARMITTFIPKQQQMRTALRRHQRVSQFATLRAVLDALRRADRRAPGTDRCRARKFDGAKEQKLDAALTRFANPRHSRICAVRWERTTPDDEAD